MVFKKFYLSNSFRKTSKMTVEIFMSIKKF